MDAFMEAARAEAKRRWPSYQTIGFSGAEDRQAAFIEGWKEARNHFTVQELSDAVIAAAIDAGVWCGEHDLGPERDCPDCHHSAAVIADAVLAAARNARQEN